MVDSGIVVRLMLIATLFQTFHSGGYVTGASQGERSLCAFLWSVFLAAVVVLGLAAGPFDSRDAAALAFCGALSVVGMMTFLGQLAYNHIRS
jgi:hypothetical protein